MGWFGVLVDPGGAPFALWQPKMQVWAKGREKGGTASRTPLENGGSKSLSSRLYDNVVPDTPNALDLSGDFPRPLLFFGIIDKPAELYDPFEGFHADLTGLCDRVGYQVGFDRRRNGGVVDVFPGALLCSSAGTSRQCHYERDA